MNQIAGTRGAEGEIDCVVLPLANVELLVPSACIAEVLPWRPPLAASGSPDWCRGTIDWHGAMVSLVDFERLLGAPARSESGKSIAVINRSRPDAPRPFMALVVQGLPRLVQIAEDDLAADHAAETPGELWLIEVGTERLVVPDLRYLETRIGEL